MKIMSFNVNGIKSFSKFVKQKYNVSFNDYLLNILKVDILCLQETKCCKKDMQEFKTLKNFITLSNINQYKNGVYGVSTIISKKMYCRKHDIKVPYSENGRSILTDHKEFMILNLYCPFFDPNGLKTKESVIKFYREIYEFIKKYDNLIVLGDMNAVYSIFDHYIYYNEYNNVYNRQNVNRENQIEILDVFSDIFSSSNFLKNFYKVASRDETINIKDLKPFENFLFGRSISLFFRSYNSMYLKYFFLSICHLKNLSINLSEKNKNKDIDYKIDLIEKARYTQTEFPYLIDNVSTLFLFFYSTYQRKWLLRFLLEMSHIDVYRIFHSEYEKYTCWNTQLNLRPINLGSRIDYIFVPIKFFNIVIYADILDQVFGSDHCPVYVNINIEIDDDKDNICKVRNNLLGFLKN